MKGNTQSFARILDGETCLLVLKDLWGVGGGLWLPVGTQILRANYERALICVMSTFWPNTGSTQNL